MSPSVIKSEVKSACLSAAWQLVHVDIVQAIGGLTTLTEREQQVPVGGAHVLEGVLRVEHRCTRRNLPF